MSVCQCMCTCVRACVFCLRPAVSPPLFCWRDFIRTLAHTCMHACTYLCNHAGHLCRRVWLRCRRVAGSGRQCFWMRRLPLPRRLQHSTKTFSQRFTRARASLSKRASPSACRCVFVSACMCVCVCGCANALLSNVQTFPPNSSHTHSHTHTHTHTTVSLRLHQFFFSFWLVTGHIAPAAEDEGTQGRAAG